MFGGHKLQEIDEQGVHHRAVIAGRRRRFRLGGEAAEGFQGGGGAHEEGLVARPLLAAGDRSGRFAALFVLLVFLRGDDFRLLRALPALHRFAVDGGALGQVEDGALPGGGAGEAFFDLAEVAAYDAAFHSQLVGDFLVGEAFHPQALDVGKELLLLGG